MDDHTSSHHNFWWLAHNEVTKNERVTITYHITNQKGLLRLIWGGWILYWDVLLYDALALNYTYASIVQNKFDHTFVMHSQPVDSQNAPNLKLRANAKHWRECICLLKDKSKIREKAIPIQAPQSEARSGCTISRS